MKVYLIQHDARPAQIRENLDKIAFMMKGVEPGSMVFLPEMFNTSYVLSAENINDQIVLESINWMQQQASSFKIVIGGSMPIYEGGKLRNRWMAYDAGGNEVVYDKIHLFKPGGEGRNYKAGESIVQCKAGDWVVRPLICYDLRFPLLSFQNVNEPYDLLVYAANWPETRINQWKQLLIARAIENQVYVVGINRCGVDQYGNVYPGCSMVVDYAGNVVLEAGSEETMLSINLDLLSMNHYRQAFPFFTDVVQKFSLKPTVHLSLSLTK